MARPSIRLPRGGKARAHRYQLGGTMAVTSIGDPAHATTRNEAASYETLVRQLLAHASQAAPVAPPPAQPSDRGDAPSEDVLFDREVDGVRCILMRAHPTPVDTLALSPREHEVARMIAKGYP